MELDNDQKFAFAAIASMSIVAYADGEQSESELEEIYIQIHQSKRLSCVTDFALEALDEVNERLKVDFEEGSNHIVNDLMAISLEHDESTDVINMAVDVMKSNKVVSPHQIDAVTGLCNVFKLYSDQFNFVT